MTGLQQSFDISSLRIGVVGAGSWGTALANLLARKGFTIDLWVFEQEVIEQIRSEKENRFFLPGVALSENLYPTQNIERVVKDKDLVLIAVPSHFMREVSGRIGALAATYVLENVGPQGHYYTPDEFVNRYRQVFGEEDTLEKLLT